MSVDILVILNFSCSLYFFRGGGVTFTCYVFYFFNLLNEFKINNIVLNTVIDKRLFYPKGVKPSYIIDTYSICLISFC